MIEEALVEARRLAHENRLEGKDLDELAELEDEEGEDFLNEYRSAMHNMAKKPVLTFDQAEANGRALLHHFQVCLQPGVSDPKGGLVSGRNRGLAEGICFCAAHVLSRHECGI